MFPAAYSPSMADLHTALGPKITGPNRYSVERSAAEGAEIWVLCTTISKISGEGGIAPSEVIVVTLSAQFVETGNRPFEVRARNPDLLG